MEGGLLCLVLLKEKLKQLILNVLDDIINACELRILDSVFPGQSVPLGHEASNGYGPSYLFLVHLQDGQAAEGSSGLHCGPVLEGNATVLVRHFGLLEDPSNPLGSSLEVEVDQLVGRHCG